MTSLSRNASRATQRTSQGADSPNNAAFVGLEALNIPPQSRYEVVLANRILAHQGVSEAYGSVSQRHPLFPHTHFIMARDIAPITVTAADVHVYRIDTSEPVDSKAAGATPERFIHSEIYKHFGTDDVGSIVVCHTPELLPFTIASVLPFKAAINKSSFLGSHAAPIFDLEHVVGPHNDTLVRDVRSGHALAKLFDVAPAPVPQKKEGGLFRSSSKKGHGPVHVPRARSCVLMRGHGAVFVGGDIQMSTLRAVYARENARVITTLHSLIGGIPGLNYSHEPTQGVKMLGEIECDLHTASQAKDAKRSWDVWVEQVADGVPGARENYSAGGAALRKSADQRASVEEDDGGFPRTTYKYSSATSPPRSSGLGATRSAQSAGSPRVQPTGSSMAKAPSVDAAILDRAAPITGASLSAPLTSESVFSKPVAANSTTLPGGHGSSYPRVNAEPTSRDYGRSQSPLSSTGSPGGPQSQPITGLGHAYGENQSHSGPAGEVVTLDQLSHPGNAAQSGGGAAHSSGVTNEALIQEYAALGNTRFREDVV